MMQLDLSHTGFIDVTKQYLLFTTDEVILFNRNHLSERMLSGM